MESKETAGAAYEPAIKALKIRIPDLAKYAHLHEGQSGEALMLEEAAHAVTTADPAARERVLDLYKSAPESLKKAIREAYRRPNSTDFNYAHELWRFILAGKVEVSRGGRIRLGGKFLPEQAFFSGSRAISGVI
jgi:hypothetical protein